MDTYTDFLRAKLTDGLMVYKDSRDEIIKTHGLSEFNFGMGSGYTWNVPVFDFGDLLMRSDDEDKEFFDERAAFAQELVRDGKFHLPFPQCAFTMNLNAKLGGHEFKLPSVFCAREDDGVITISMYQNHLEVSKKLPVQFPVLWACVCLHARIVGEKYQVEDVHVTTVRPEEKEFVFRRVMRDFLAAMGLLFSEKSVQKTSELTFAAKRLQAKHRKELERPLHRPITIDIDAVRRDYEVRRELANRHMVSAHEVRGHVRHLRSGKTVWVRPHQVGEHLARKPSYRVKRSQGGAGQQYRALHHSRQRRDDLVADTVADPCRSSRNRRR